MYTATLGAAPNRQYVIEYRNVPWFFFSDYRITFEIVLQENGVILFQYQSLPDNLLRGRYALVGIEDDAGTVAIQYLFRDETVLAPGQAIRFLPPGVTAEPPAPAR